MKKLLLLLVLLLPLSLLAQVTTSNISGTIKDAKGETIPGSTVYLVLPTTGTKYAAITDVSGIFHVYNASVGGPYNIKVTSVGFKPYQKSDVYLTLGNNDLNVLLEEENTQLTEVVVTSTKGGTKTGEQLNLG